MNKFTFICGASRSGTTLLTNLLDGHSRLSVFPYRETTILEYWFKYKRSDDLERFFCRDYFNTPNVLLLSNEDVVKQFSDYMFLTYGNKDYCKGKITDREGFIELYLGYLQNNGFSLKNIYYALFYAAFSINKLDVENKIFIEKRPLANEICAPMLAKEFPKAKFIHIVRDPRTRYLSAKMRRVRNIKGIFKFIDNFNGKDFATAHAEISMVSLELARLNKIIIKERYHILRYEDLMDNEELEMRKISDFLEIDFEPGLLQPLSLGKKISPSSSITKMPEGVVINTNKDRLERYYRNTSRSEQSILRILNWDIASYFNYDIEPMEFIKRYALIRPLKYENPLKYFSNRLRMFKKLLGYSWTTKFYHYQALLDEFFEGVQIAD